MNKELDKLIEEVINHINDDQDPIEFICNVVRDKIFIQQQEEEIDICHVCKGAGEDYDGIPCPECDGFGVLYPEIECAIRW